VNKDSTFIYTRTKSDKAKPMSDADFLNQFHIQCWSKMRCKYNCLFFVVLYIIFFWSLYMLFVDLIYKLNFIRYYIRSLPTNTCDSLISPQEWRRKKIQQRLFVCPYPLAIYIYTTTRRKSNRKREKKEKKTFIIH